MLNLRKLGLFLGVLVGCLPAFADGTETLGPASIPLSAGSGFAVGGVGLFDEHNGSFSNLDGDIFVSVPAGATVKQVLLYWISEHYPQSGPDATLSVNGTPVTGQLIGGSTNFFSVVYFAAFRADITSLGVVAPGGNVLSITDLDSSFRNTGAGVLVVYDNGNGASLQLLDGLDLAYWRLSPPLDAVVPQTFTFPAANVARTAQIPLHVGSVGNGRPNVTRVTSGGITETYYNLFTSLDGSEWDSQILEANVPAGATSLTIGLYSETDGSTNNPASLAWVAAGLALRTPVKPNDPCGECDGKVSELTLKYNGSSAAAITVTQKDGNKTPVVFDGTVQPGGTFSMIGVDKQKTLGPEIQVYVNGVLNTKIHTSCSQPIGPGMVSGSFEVVMGRSRNGGLLCPIDNGGGGGDPDPDPDCGECDGKVTTLSLEYTGSAPADVVVRQKDGSKRFDVFNGTVQPGEVITVVGVDKQNTLGPEIEIYTNNSLHAKLHTSCSQPIGPGTVAGKFVVVSGASRNGGVLCPVSGGGGGGGEEPPVTDVFCETGKPGALVMLYTGDSCAATAASQDLSFVTCAGDPAGAGVVRIVASDMNNPNHAKARTWFAGEVALGQQFEISAANGATSRLKGNTYVFIYDLGGNLLQSVSFHTSCSQPLVAGDQFGAVQLIGYTAEQRLNAGRVTIDEAALPAVGCAGGSGATGSPAGDLAVMLGAAALLAVAALRRRAAC